jgi:hypothetical protein
VIRASAIAASLLFVVSAAAGAQPVTVRAGAHLTLVTSEDLSSKTTAKGDIVALRLAQDFSIDGRVVIPAGTPAVGQVSDARASGGLGVSGKLAIKPLYVRVRDVTIRLKGTSSERASVDSGVVVGVALVGVASGHSATIPAGTILAAEVEKDVSLEPIAPPK